jgi:hypothetical protein
VKGYKHVSPGKPHKVTPSKYVRVPGRDFHSAKEKEVTTSREGAKSGHKEAKRDK